MPQSIEFFRSVPRWLVVRALSTRWPAAATGTLSCIRIADLPEPRLPSPEWVRIRTRLSGVCGSDLSAIGCKGSPYFSPFVSTPFVPGHELVGEIAETGAAVPPEWRTGQRVVLEPALCCAVRGIVPACAPCEDGNYANCENILKGSIAAGIQTGYCNSTGGGWSAASVVAHHSQLHVVPETLSDEEAVLAEPFACAVHAALKAPRDSNNAVVVLGCGSIGLLTIYAYKASGGKARVLASARYEHQARMAQSLGADEVFDGRGRDALYRWVLERSNAARGNSRHDTGVYQPELGKPVLLGGAECVIDCVGSSDSIDDALRLTAPRGTLILAGMPGIPKQIDWTSIWYKELHVQGAYAYGWEDCGGKHRRTMELALELLANSSGKLKPLVNRKYPLREYRAALEGAFRAGRSGAIKTVFEVK